MVATWLNGPSLASVYSAALPTTPGELCKSQDFLLQRMVDGDRESAVSIHLGHLSEKARSMVWPLFQNVVLPLMNHFVRQRAPDLLLAILALLDNLLE
jgi:hypothetical protein